MCALPFVVLLCMYGCAMAAFYLYDGRGYVRSIALVITDPPVTIQWSLINNFASFFTLCIAWLVLNTFSTEISSHLLSMHQR